MLNVKKSSLKYKILSVIIRITKLITVEGRRQGFQTESKELKERTTLVSVFPYFIFGSLRQGLITVAKANLGLAK